MKYDVCVVGGASLDRMYYQKSDGTYNNNPDIIFPGGKGANQAVAASRAGAKTTMISRIGKDDIGKTILDNLIYNGVNTSYIEMVEKLENDYSDIYINLNDKDNDIIRHNGAINSFDEDIIDRYKDIILNSNIIISQLKVPKEVTVKLINLCYSNNKMLILTPCRPDKLNINDENNIDLIDKISIITCNKSECISIFNTDNIEECVKKYPNKLIVTLGKDGLIYFNGERIVHMPSIDMDNIIDTTGAGDTLCGNLAAGLCDGLDLEHALRRSMYASCMKLEKKGAQDGMPYKDELNIFIKNKRTKKFKYNKELNLILDNIKQLYSKTNKIEIYEKDDKTLVTSTDLYIENKLIKLINKSFPNDNFLTEENYSDNVLQPRTWVIDPIDGTNHYLKNDGNYSTQLAFYDNDDIQFSVIFIPSRDELYYAVKNNGVYLNNNKLFLRHISPINMSVIEFGGSINKNIEEKKNMFNKFIDDNGNRKVLDFLYLNAGSISFTNLITGKTDALIISTEKPWDILPGILMCKELGIKIYNLSFKNTLKLYTKNEKIKELLSID